MNFEEFKQGCMKLTLFPYFSNEKKTSFSFKYYVLDSILVNLIYFYYFSIKINSKKMKMENIWKLK